MRVLLPVFALAAAAAATASPATAPLVRCDEIILQAPSGRAGGYRVVLGILSVPPAKLHGAVRVYGKRWPYWQKAGLVIRASRRVVRVSVPRAWRRRAAITWGNATPIAASLRFQACPSPAGVWNAYAGGFYLRAAKACVPLRFAVGERSRVVRFGIGRLC